MNKLHNIIQWNCNGVKHYYVDLKHIMTESSPFCICLQETHLKPGEEFHLRGYHCCTKNVQPDHRARGGVAIYTKNNIPVRQLQLTTNLQAVAIHLDFPFKLVICNLYLPDFNWSKNDVQNLIRQLPTPFLMLGDFNAHNPLWGSNHKDIRGRILDEILNELDLVLLNTGEMTYFNARSNSFSAIDLTFCSPQVSDRLLWSTIRDYLPSDHIPIKIEISEAFIAAFSTKKWKLEAADWLKFKDDLPLIEYSEDVNTCANLITSAILQAAENSVPTSNGICHKPRVPWWNDDVATAIRDKKRALYRFKRHPSDANKIEFKRARAIARRTILVSKNQSWQKYVSSISTSTPTSEVWQKVRAIRGKKFPQVSPVLDVNGYITSEPQEVVEALADHFREVSSTSNYDLSFLRYKNANEVPLDFNEPETSFYNKPFLMKELDIVLEEARNSAPGDDSIPYEMIRQLPKSYKELLLRLFNKIWLDGTYPDQWKRAIIVPLLKEGKDPKLPSSYRPLSLTCCLGKIIEKMVSHRLIWYLENKSLLSESQMGFRKHRSTIDNLVHLETVIQNGFAERNHTVVIFFDLEKAFDMVWRYGILKTLYKWGLRGNLPLFITSFLDNRSFRVKLASTISESRMLQNGIPQGSTLSVVLFAIAINNLLTDLSPNVGRMLYVDDLAVYYTAENLDDLEVTLQTAIDTLCNSNSSNGFRFSPTKTHCVHFCRLRREHRHPELHLYDQTLEFKSQTKFLGVILDQKLYWGPHIQYITNKCKKNLNLLKCLANTRWGADREMLLRIYVTLVLSRIDYACIVYGSARKSRLKPLDSIHCSGLRLALGAFRTSPLSSLCCESGIPPLKYRRQQFLVSYGATIWAQPTHPNYKFLFDEELRNTYQARPTITRPVGVRLNEIMETMEEYFPPVYKIGPCEVPPWILITANIILKYDSNSREETNRQLLASNFYTALNPFEEYHKLYTDGSKLDQGVGCSFFDESQTYSWSLPNSASIYTAELYAIWQALRYTEMNTWNDTIICSDSLSALQGLSNINTDDPLIQNILALIHWLGTLGKRIALIWTPSHVGIRGNEIADRAAKEAAAEITINNIVIRHNDTKIYLKEKVITQWQNEWNNQIAKLKEIKPKVSKWERAPSLQRREQVVLARLRIGHTNLTNIYLLTGNQQPICQVCNAVVTVKHIILECQDYEQHRRRLKIPDQLHLCLGQTTEGVKKTMNFLRATNLFLKI